MYEHINEIQCGKKCHITRIWANSSKNPEMWILLEMKKNYRDVDTR